MIPIPEIPAQEFALRGREVQAAHSVARRHHEREDVCARQVLAWWGQLGIYPDREEERFSDERGRPGDQVFDAHDGGEESQFELLDESAEEIVDCPCGHVHEGDVGCDGEDRGEDGHGEGFYGVEGPGWPGGGKGNGSVEGEAEVVDVGGGCVCVHV